MKLHKRYKLDRAASRSQDTHFATECIHVDAENARAVATDGRILASVPCDLSAAEDLVGGSATFPVDALKAARKVAGRAQEVEMSIDTGEVHVDTESGRQSFRQSDGEYPNYRSVLPSGEGGYKVTLNAELLHKLADALGAFSGGVTLTFQKAPGGSLDAKRPIHVAPVYDSEGAPAAPPVGVIMPIVPSA